MNESKAPIIIKKNHRNKKKVDAKTIRSFRYIPIGGQDVEAMGA